MIKTFLLDTRALPDPADAPPGLKTCMNRLPAGRMEKILRIRHADARKQSLGAGLLLTKVLDTLPAGAEITYGSFGKPLCAGLPLNLSHTKDAVILSMQELQDAPQPDSAASNPGADALIETYDPDAGLLRNEDADILIGCDIEQMKPYQSGIARRYFTKAEYQSLEDAGDPQKQAELFCRYWTRKESVMKLTGLGMLLPMELFDVQGSRAAADIEKIHAWHEKVLRKGQAQAEYEKAAGLLLHREIYFQEYRYKGCCIAVCSLASQFAPCYEQITVDECLGTVKK